MESLTFKLDEFEGPLDLLLHLVSQNKMDLYDIPILELIEQYTTLIRTLQQNRLDVASVFIEMAAQLVQMKSYLLLPRSEDAERMKQELQGQLIEYSACKRVAAQLRAMQENVYCVVRSPAQIEPDHEYRLQHDHMLLLNALQGLSGRSASRAKPTQERFEPLVTAPFVSVASRVSHMLRGLLKGSLHKMGQLFSPEDSRSTNVATFLALLELIRAGRVQVADDGGLQLDRTHRRRKENPTP